MTYIGRVLEELLGEERVRGVYRGDSNRKIGYGKDWDTNGHFFTDNVEVAKTYANPFRDGEGVVGKYDVEGKNLSAINFHGADVHGYRKREKPEQGKRGIDFYMPGYPRGHWSNDLDAKGVYKRKKQSDRYDKLPGHCFGDKVVFAKMKRGSDLVVQKNVVDPAGYPERYTDGSKKPSNTFVVKDRKQAELKDIMK